MSSDPVSRRRFLTVFLVAGPTVAVAARIGLDGALAQLADAEGVASPEVPDAFDGTDYLVGTGQPYYYDLYIEITQDNRVRFQVPRQEAGQGIVTTAAMILADNLDVRLEDIDATLSPAELQRRSSQITGGSHSTRSLWDPIRVLAGELRARLATAGAERLGVPPETVRTEDTHVVATDGRRVSYGEIAEAAAKIAPRVSPAPKPLDRLRIVGTPRSRLDARQIATGQVVYAMDLVVPEALPTVLVLPATYGAGIVSVDDRAARAMPGVVAVTPIPGLADILLPPAVAVTARSFPQALAARKALTVSWGQGPMDGVSDQQIREQLQSILDPMTSPDAGDGVDAVFEWPFVPHAPMETNDAVADVRPGRAEIWTGANMPVLSVQDVARTLGLREDQVTLHCTQTGGSFGRRLFHDAAVHAAQISQRIGRPVRLMHTREDDVRHGRCRPASVHHVRATVRDGEIISYEHRMAGAELNSRHGLGDTNNAFSARNDTQGFNRSVFTLTQKMPYKVGRTALSLRETPYPVPTAALRSVYSGTFSTVNEIVIDELARRLGQDEYDFRRERLDTDRARAVLDKVCQEGQWGKAMPAGTAQGLGMHDEYKSIVAFLMECDARGPEPRITKVTIAVDPGRVVNPKGLEAQMMGVTMDGIALAFSAGVHIDNGLIRESGLHDYRWTRMYNSPYDITVHILPPTTAVPGGIGELGLPGATAAAANAWARATGQTPRRFPIKDN